MSRYRCTCPHCNGWAKKVVRRDGLPTGYQCIRGHRWDWLTGEDLSADLTLRAA